MGENPISSTLGYLTHPYVDSGLDEVEEAENLSTWPKRALGAGLPAPPGLHPSAPSAGQGAPERVVVRGVHAGGVVYPRARHAPSLPPLPHLQAHAHGHQAVAAVGGHQAKDSADERPERRNSEDEWKNINMVGTALCPQD